MGGEKAIFMLSLPIVARWVDYFYPSELTKTSSWLCLFGTISGELDFTYNVKAASVTLKEIERRFISFCIRFYRILFYLLQKTDFAKWREELCFC